MPFGYFRTIENERLSNQVERLFEIGPARNEGLWSLVIFGWRNDREPFFLRRLSESLNSPLRLLLAAVLELARGFLPGH